MSGGISTRGVDVHNRREPNELLPPGVSATTPASRWHPRTIIRTGVIGGWVAIYLCLVGIVPVFDERPLIIGVISLGQTALLIAFAGGAYVAARAFIRDSWVQQREFAIFDGNPPPETLEDFEDEEPQPTPDAPAQ